ncbi:hypothetical protein ACHAPE_000882 [Trichoderma viride]
MQFSTIALFATGALASICPNGLYSNPQCCGANVLDVAALDCHTPRVTPLNGPIFQAICAAEGGKEALCCVVPVAGQDLLCQPAIGAQ